MLLKIKSALSNAAIGLGDFQTLDTAELEEFAQNYDFAQPLIRLEPMDRYTGSVGDGGVILNTLEINTWFLTKFPKDDNDEDGKDVLIDAMEDLSNDYYRVLNQSSELAQGTLETWNTRIVRRTTSNLLCGVVCTTKLNTACNR